MKQGGSSRRAPVQKAVEGHGGRTMPLAGTENNELLLALRSFGPFPIEIGLQRIEGRERDIYITIP